MSHQRDQPARTYSFAVVDKRVLRGLGQASQLGDPFVPGGPGQAATQESGKVWEHSHTKHRVCTSGEALEQRINRCVTLLHYA